MSVDNTDKQATFTEDLGELLESVGERLGSELYHVISPVLKSASSFRSRFIIGFKRGWSKAREGQANVVVDINAPITTGPTEGGAFTNN